MSPTLWNGQIRDILNAAGGNSQADLVGGVRPTLLGYPVNLVNAMKGAGASSSLTCSAYSATSAFLTTSVIVVA